VTDRWVLSASIQQSWQDFWAGRAGEWLATTGLHVVLVIACACVAAAVIRRIANRVSRRLDDSHPADALVRSERVKHRKAVASVISSLAISVLVVLVAVDVLNQIGLPVGTLVAPAAVVGAALGLGAQRIVADVLSGFFIIVERQYGFGDLVQLTITGAAKEAMGTVEDVTLRVTKLRNTDGEVSTIPNGQIVKSHNLSKDWARAVVDIPVPATADITRVDELLRDVSALAMQDAGLPALLLDEPSVMGVESLEKDVVNVRMVARTLPGKQFEVGRRLRVMVLTALRGNGVRADAYVESSDGHVRPDVR
jgi:moderate conductance mechanosensitive channel